MAVRLPLDPVQPPAVLPPAVLPGQGGYPACAAQPEPWAAWPGGGERDWDWSCEDWVADGWEPGDCGDPETDPDDTAAWLASLPADVRERFTGDTAPAVPLVPAGFTHHQDREDEVSGVGGPPDDDGGGGAGFIAGGAFDVLAPGPLLASGLAAASGGGCRELGEDALIGVLCGWQRLAAWAAAGQVSLVLALARRRAAQSAAPGSSRLAEHVSDELAAALTLTGRSAGRLLTVACGLARLPEVRAALECGRLDWPKACVLVDELDTVEDDVLAAGIAARLVARAGPGGWTTGQLRAAARRAVLAADPVAAGRRRVKARAEAQVQVWAESSGNCALAGRELPPAEVAAADVRLTALARWLQSRGAAGTISQLRAAAYGAILAGRPVSTLLPPAAAAGVPGPDTAQPDAADPDTAQPDAAVREPAHGPAAEVAASHGAADQDSAAAGSAGQSAAGPGAAAQGAAAQGAAGPDGCGWPTAGWPAVTGTIHLTMPMSAWLGGGAPGEIAGHGPLDAGSSRELAAMLAEDPATRCCLTLTDHAGQAVAHACARRPPPPGTAAVRWAGGLRDRMASLARGCCGHARQAPGYQPSAILRHLIGVRQRTCAFPGCRRPARRCDLDHTLAYERGGITCECNLAPLCRRHHQAKQAPGWHLEQPEPGQMTWRLPSDRIYQTTGDPY